ncbi:hypothetical protein BJF78_32815 [Pseudonocardia sp. CNS-139]|nr:hypothetical protein BJF78_32815 [Pseudonocardia sp. CNS-139]
MRRYLTSRKNIAGMAGALVGVGLYAAGAIGDIWPAVAVGLYVVGALVAPADPGGEPRLTDVLRDEAADLVARIQPRQAELPAGTVPAVRQIVEVVRLVLDRLDQVADQPVDRPPHPSGSPSPPRSCASTCRSASTPTSPRAVQLGGPGSGRAGDPAGPDRGRADRLAAQVPDVHVQRAEELTRELRRRYGEPPR